MCDEMVASTEGKVVGTRPRKLSDDIHVKPRPIAIRKVS